MDCDSLHSLLIAKDKRLGAFVQEELISSIQEADLAELTTGIQQLANTQQLPDKKLMDALSAKLASHFADPTANAGSLMAAFSGLAALGYQPSSAFLREVSDAMTVRLGDCTAQDISRLDAIHIRAAYFLVHKPLLSLSRLESNALTFSET